MSETSKPGSARFDWGFVLILMSIGAVAVWLLSMPVCRFVQRSTMNRFQLQTKSFAAWSIQQPIPAMYNFYNRFAITPSPSRSLYAPRFIKGTVNHFPLRLFTFGDNRAIFLPPHELRGIDIWTSYRGEELHTRWLAMPTEDGGFDLSGAVVE